MKSTHNKTYDILDLALELSDLSFISDLKSAKEHVEPILFFIVENANSFTPEQWSETVSYLMDTDVVFRNSSDAEEFIRLKCIVPSEEQENTFYTRLKQVQKEISQ